MSLLYKLGGPPGEPLASVLFVHGLGGHHYGTWRRDAGREAWNEDDTFWPLWLARDCEMLAVLAAIAGTIKHLASVSRLCE